MRRSALGLLLLGLLAAPARAADPVIVAAGDIACDTASTSFNGGEGTPAQGGAPPASAGKCHMKATSDLFAALNPTKVLAVGDTQNADGVFAKYQASYDPSWGRAYDITEPVPGNHEYGAGNTQDGHIAVNATASGYFQYFQNRLAPHGPAALDAKKGWYSFDVAVPAAPGAASAKWHIVAINSECAAGQAEEVGALGACAAGSEQERWLRADLAANKSECTLAFWHQPLFASGGSGNSPQMAPIWDALSDDYADIVLSGHRHTYERFAQQDSAGKAAPGRGIREWVVGTGGEVLHPLGTPKPNSEVFDNSTFGVLALTLHGPAAAHPRGWYSWRFVGDGVSGSTFGDDAGSGDCVGPPLPAKPAVAKPASKAVADRIAPKLSRARLSRRRFRVGSGPTARTAKVPRGTVIAYTLSEAARSSLRFERRKKGRYRRAGVLKRRRALGRWRVRFSGRIGKRALKPGRYRLTITARDVAGNLGKGKRLYFTVVR